MAEQLGFSWTPARPRSSRSLRCPIELPPDLGPHAPIKLTCQTCGDEFVRTKRQLRNHSGRFCSLSCSASHSNRTRPKVKLPPRPGPLNPNWKGGVSKDHMRYKRRFEAKSPEKVRAHRIVQRAIESGHLIRQTCEVCGTANRIHAHHDDYSKPLQVNWLCQLHHNQRHAWLRAQIKTAPSPKPSAAHDAFQEQRFTTASVTQAQRIEQHGKGQR